MGDVLSSLLFMDLPSGTSLLPGTKPRAIPDLSASPEVDREARARAWRSGLGGLSHERRRTAQQSSQDPQSGAESQARDAHGDWQRRASDEDR